MGGIIMNLSREILEKKKVVKVIKKENVFQLQEAIYYDETYKIETIRKIITKNDMPLTIINNWLSTLSTEGTTKGYAYKLKRYLEYIDRFGVEFYDVKDSVLIVNFLKKIMRENPKKNISTVEIQIGYNTIDTNALVIKEFYLWLDEMFNVDKIMKNPEITYEMQKYYEIKNRKNKKKKDYKNETKIINFDYFDIWSKDFMEILGIKRSSCKNNKVEHIKWYSKEDIKIIKTNFNTKRDLAIFCLGLAGGRIEEIVTIKKEDYISSEKKVYISESKTMLRWLYLKPSVCQIIEDYLFTERDVIENEMGFEGVEPYLFINLATNSKGKKVQQGNYRKILKRVGKKSGFNPEEVITHAGRHTLTQQMIKLEYTNQQIMTVLGWNSEETIELYKKKFDNDIALSASKKINRRERDV
ncbi:MAG: tyrosine-type recombinase/integrase [Clostridium sp.]|uniref:tyrosine-type recombinase/integrase n=1 Tax=Clostridium sp. TaxID=1506 RepID=UPI003D6D1A98